jgi:two-component system LytT family response regulator
MKDKYECIIVDDERKAIEYLADILAGIYSNISVQSTHTTWKTAIQALREHEVDLLFLDISMPQKSGMDLLKLLPDLKCEVIFVTAYSEYALNAFTHQASGYLLKPVKEAMLVKTVDKALERVNYKRKAMEKTSSHDVSQVSYKIGIPNNKGMDYININDIIYVEAVKRYTKIIRKDSAILSSCSIGKFKKMLETHYFCQIHRSYIVNLNFIERYNTLGAVVMANGVEIPVSKSAKDEFLKALDHIVTKGEIS